MTLQSVKCLSSDRCFSKMLLLAFSATNPMSNVGLNWKIRNENKQKLLTFVLSSGIQLISRR